MNLWQRRGVTRSADIVVRWAREDDAEAISRMARALSLSDGGRPSRFTVDGFLRDGFGETPWFHTVIAEVDGEPAGYAVYYFGYDTDTASPGVYLADLYVAETRRRLGVGRRLVGAVAEAGRARGGRWMFWSVLRQNKGARRFYRTIAPELKDVIICAAFGANFDRLADGAREPVGVRRPD